MRYLGGGIGHKAADFIQQHTAEHEPELGPDPDEEAVAAGEIPEEFRLNNDDADDEEVEVVDEEEEADFGYGDDVRSEDEGSNQDEDRDESEEDEDNGFDEL